jgi:hypothetical protein
MWYVVCGMWYVVCGMWYVVCGMWYVVCGMWYVVCGMWYAVCGMWEWTGRDDGGFDCMTEIIAPASNVFGAPLGDPEDKEAFEIPAELRNQIREQRKYLSWRESEVKDVRDDKDLQEGLKELGNFVFEVVKWNWLHQLV